MEQAIVAGANGYVGFHVVNELLKNNIQVIAISRYSDSEILNKFENHNNLSHISLNMRDIHLLPEILNSKNIKININCVFYNFCWLGNKRLMDGLINQQILNVLISANAVKVASEIGCNSYIDSGSIEESLLELYLINSWRIAKYESLNGNYAISKLASRDMCSLVSYLSKINYIHTRFSATIDSGFKSLSYISQVCRKITNGDLNWDKPQNQNLFDLIDIEDLSKAYYMLGIHGKNKGDYFIGSGNPQTLDDYFVDLQNWIKHKKMPSKKDYCRPDVFCTNDFITATNLDLSNSFSNLLLKVNLV